MKCFVSWVTYEPKFLPTMQCQVGLYFLSNSFLMYAAMSFSMLYFSIACAAQSIASCCMSSAHPYTEHDGQGGSSLRAGLVSVCSERTFGMSGNAKQRTVLCSPIPRTSPRLLSMGSYATHASANARPQGRPHRACKGGLVCIQTCVDPQVHR